MKRTDAMLFGRRTWEKAAAGWPKRSGDPFADRINAIPKYVATRTLGQSDLDAWSGSTALPGDDLVGAVRELRESDGNGLYVLGSASVAKTLVEHDLVDEYVLLVEPILLGGGKRIFPDDATARRLELVSAEPTSTGVLMCTYRPVRD
jgi:dihydrofolate reductase